MPITYPISPIDQRVIDIVRCFRLERQLSQADLADILLFTRGYITHVEGPGYPAKYNLSHINTLAWFWDLSPRDFLPELSFDPNKIIIF